MITCSIFFLIASFDIRRQKQGIFIPGLGIDITRISTQIQVNDCYFLKIQLKLEITEGVILSDTEDPVSKMNTLRSQGVRFSIDDFGTGYSSFINFKKLPIDEIKIDRSFVFNAVKNQQDASIVEATINIGKAFGFGVVAEGIEDEETVGLLQRLGCHHGQGFHFAKPMEMERFAYWLGQVPITPYSGVSHQSAS